MNEVIPKSNPPLPNLINEYWYRGNLAFKLRPIQKRLRGAFNACKNFLFVCEVARQTGKTFTWADECIELGLKKKNARMRYGTAFQEDVEEFLRPVIETIIDDCPEDIRPKWRSKGSKYVFPSTGAELKVFGIDLHPNAVRGNALDLVVIDEGGFVKHLKKVINILIFMLRSRPQLRVILSSSTSETPDHDFTAYADQAAIDGNYFFATINHDETCTQETKDIIAAECGGYDTTTYRREALCERVTDAELAIVPEWDDRFIQELPRDEFFQFYHRYSSLDLGVSDFTAGIYGYYDFKRATFQVLAESKMKGPAMTTDKLSAQIKLTEYDLWGGKSLDGDEDDGACERCLKFNLTGVCRCREWERKKVYRRVSDNNNLLLINDLNHLHGMDFRATDKDELPAMVNDLRLLVKQGRFLIHPRCIMLIACCKYGIYNSAKIQREFARSKVYGHYDWLASAVYLVRNLDEKTNPISLTHGLHYTTHHIPADLEKAEKEKGWAQVAPQKFVSRTRN